MLGGSVRARRASLIAGLALAAIGCGFHGSNNADGSGLQPAGGSDCPGCPDWRDRDAVCASGWPAGREDGVPDWPEGQSVTAFGARSGDGDDDSAAFQAAIDAADPGAAVTVPPGHFRLERSLRMRSGVTLRGAGPGASTLELAHGGDGVVFRGPEEPDTPVWVRAEAGLSAGSRQLTVADASAFAGGGFALIRQDNDADRMYTRASWRRSWAQAVVGQVLRIEAVAGDTLTLAEPLNITFNPALQPRVRPLAVIRDAGLEGVRLSRRADNDAYAVVIDRGAGIWVADIVSERAARSHVLATRSYRCEIRHSRFDDASDHGPGGHGYGVYLADQTSACLVEDNLFRRLRHAMVVSRGANGNVFGYNLSRQPWAEGGFAPPDISVHGHFPFANLFEGNVVQSAFVSDYWGPSGPANLFFRNRIERGDLVVHDHSDYQRIIGNRLVRGVVRIDDSVDRSTLTLHANGADPDAVGLPESCYLVRPGGFARDGRLWSRIGAAPPG